MDDMAPAKITKFTATAEYEICPLCDSGLGLPRVTRVRTKYHGVHGEVDRHYRECTGMHGCGSFYAGAEEMRKNRQAMMEFRHGVGGVQDEIDTTP